MNKVRLTAMKELELLKKKAEQGDAVSQCRLASNYANGDGGVRANKKEAVKWFRKAADQGDDGAQFFLGKCYADGEGVPVDKAEAARLYRLSAEQGFLPALYFIAECYAKGEGVEMDKQEAVKWYRLAAEKKLAIAVLALGYCHAKGEGVSANKKQAFKLFKEAANLLSKDAMRQVAHCYDSGEGVPFSRKKASEWYMRAAEGGDAQAQFILGTRFAAGLGVPADMEDATKWYRLAANQGHAQAQCILASCYARGVGVPVDIEKATKLYRLAAKQGNDEAALALKTLSSDTAPADTAKVNPISARQGKPTREKTRQITIGKTTITATRDNLDCFNSSFVMKGKQLNHLPSPEGDTLAKDAADKIDAIYKACTKNGFLNGESCIGILCHDDEEFILSSHVGALDNLSETLDIVIGDMIFYLFGMDGKWDRKSLTFKIACGTENRKAWIKVSNSKGAQIATILMFNPLIDRRVLLTADFSERYFS